MALCWQSAGFIVVGGMRGGGGCRSNEGLMTNSRVPRDRRQW